MLALLVSCAILAYLALLGIAVACCFSNRLTITTLFVSPAVGMGVFLANVLSLNRLGIPEALCAPYLAVGLGIFCALILWRTRPVIPWRETMPLTLVLLVGTLLAGLPMLLFGFHWAGNGNGDMGIYTSSGVNFLRSGFFDVPNLRELMLGSNAPKNMWFWEVLPPNRYGSDAMVAAIAAILRLPTYESYMVCCVSGFSALVAATAALCSEYGSKTRWVLAGSFMAAACPLMLFVVYQQILPQLWGQVGMVAFVALAQAPALTVRIGPWQKGGVLACVLVGLLLIYPEISPLLTLGVVVIAPFIVFKNRTQLGSWALHGGIVCLAVVLGVAVLLNMQLFTVAATFKVLFAIGSNVTNGGIGVIYYFMVPSGLANIWGLLPLDSYPEPWLSVSIAIGLVMFFGLAISALLSLKRARYSTGMLIGLQAFALFLFYKRSSYGLFKAAFLLQPFMLAFIASVAASAETRLRGVWPTIGRALPVVTVAVAVGMTGYSTYIYLGATLDAFRNTSAQYTELHAASADDLYGQLDSIRRRYDGRAVNFVSDMLLSQIAVFEGIALRGHPLEFRSLDPYPNMFGRARANAKMGTIIGWPRNARSDAAVVASDRTLEYRSHVFLENKKIVHYYAPPNVRAPYAQEVLLETGPQLSILNRDQGEPPFGLRAVPMAKVQNWLCLVNSDLGAPPEYGSPALYAIGPVEPDPFYHLHTMASLGDAILLEVINSTPTVRIRLSVSASMNPRPYNDLPVVTIEGKADTTFHLDSSGAARILTPPLRPMKMHGRYYFIVRFGNRTYQFRHKRSWLMSLYGKDVNLEARKFALFGRDISTVNKPIKLPTELTSLSSLYNDNVIFSGVFEDGWLSRKFSLRLRAPASRNVLWLRVNIPPSTAARDVDIQIDNGKSISIKSTPGTYATFRVSGVRGGVHTVTIRARASRSTLLHDDRPAWGRLRGIGFSPLGRAANGKTLEATVTVSK